MAANPHIAAQEPEMANASAGSKRMSVAIIGPDEASRKVVWKAVAQSDANDVQEILQYPANYTELTLLLEQNFDVILIDVECDPAVALQLIWKMKALSPANLIAYSNQDDAQLSALCTEAGAQDFLALPQQPAAPSAAAVPPPPPRPAPPPARQSATAAPAASTPATLVTSAPAAPASALPAAKSPEAPERSATFVRGPDGQWRPQQSSAPRPLTSAQPAPAPLRSEPVAPRLQPAPVAPPMQVAPVPDAVVPPPAPAIPRPLIQPVEASAAPRAPIASPAAVIPAAGAALPAQEKDIEHELRTLFRSVADTDQEEVKTSPVAKKAAAAAGAVILVLVAAFAYLHASRPHVQVHAAPRAVSPEAAQPLAAAAIPAAPAPVASRSVPAQPEFAAATAVPQSRTAEVASVNPVSASTMNAQLSAPSRISASLKQPSPSDQAPAALSANSIGGGAALPGSIFAASRGPRVTTSPVISAGVAQGLLVHRTQPIYPAPARTANMSGTVVLKAQISKSGQIMGLKVISGPPVFVASALNAVKSWRYKPYMLNNQPIEVETNINVIFSVGNN